MERPAFKGILLSEDNALTYQALFKMRTAAKLLLAVLLLVGGMAVMLTSLATIATYAWPQPTQDQFRLYRNYLEHPFPENVLIVENQHRPIVPGLIRVAEIGLRDADQTIQIAFGVICACLAALLGALFSWRDARQGLVIRAAGASAAVIAIFWLGNARMLLHGNELVHAYLVVLAVVSVAAAAWYAKIGRPLLFLSVGSVAAAVATFSFGPGIALFPTLVILGALQRLPVRFLGIPVLICLACLVLYVLVLPGDATVRQVLAFRPLEIADVSARWIAAPWANAWLGFADPPLVPVHVEHLAKSHWHPWVDSANALQSLTGLSWMYGIARAVGVAGLAVLAAALVQAMRAREGLGRMQCIALAAMLFGAACAVIIGMGRLQYLLDRPDQVFSDRYLPWSCLFWFGVAVWCFTTARRSVRYGAVTVMAMLPLAIWPSHELGAGWGAAVYHGVQATAAAAESDVLDPNVLWRDDPSAAFEDKLRTIANFRARGLAMFARPATRRLGERWSGSVEGRQGIAASILAVTPAEDVRGFPRSVKFEGILTGVEGLESHLVLAVLDESARIVGYAEPAFDARPEAKLRWWPTTLQGFVGFVRDYNEEYRYRLVTLDSESNVALLLTQLPTP